jgi:putative flippase GtrA
VRFFKYFLVQVAAYLTDVMVFVLMVTYFGLEPLLGNVFGKIISAIFAYYTHSFFTFLPGTKVNHARMAIKYCLALLINILLTTVLLWLLIFLLHHAVLAKFSADVICFSISYWILKKYVFVREKEMFNNFTKH